MTSSLNVENEIKQPDMNDGNILERYGTLTCKDPHRKDSCLLTKEINVSGSQDIQMERVFMSKCFYLSSFS